MEDIWLWPTGARVLAAALVVALTYLVVASIRPRQGPPTVFYWIPWVGSALSLGKDPDRFFTWAQERYGSLFRIKTFGSDSLYITSPSLINEVYRDQETFVFVPIRLEMSVSVFTISNEKVYDPRMVNAYFGLHHRLLSPKHLPPFLKAYTGQVDHALQSDLLHLPQRSGRMRLRNLLLPPAYASASCALLGSRYKAPEYFGAFQEFDSMFPLIVIGAPAFVLRSPRRAWDQVIDSVQQHISKPDLIEDAFELVQETIDCWRSQEYIERDIAAMLAADLWALNANAIWAAYWIFALHLRDRPEGLSLLIAEVDASRMAYVAANPSSKPITEDPEAMHAWLSGASASMPLLNSAIQETLRIASSSASVRSVTRDTVLSEHHLKRGERIVCYSRAIHLDDEIHEAPDQYEPARFVDTSKVRTKDGKRVTNHSLPFGGGVSMCEGRHFAQTELRTYVAVVLTLMELRLDKLSHMKVEMDMGRIGLGIMQARGDLDVLVSPRVV